MMMFLRKLKFTIPILLFFFVSCETAGNPQSEVQSSSEESPVHNENDKSHKALSQKPLLGVRFQKIGPITHIESLQGRYGVKVLMVMLNTSAYDAGLREGDIIYEFDQQTFDAAVDQDLEGFFRNYISSKKIGDELTLKILRLKKQVTGFAGDFQYNRDELEAEKLSQTLQNLPLGQSASVAVTNSLEFMIVPVILKSNPHYFESSVSETDDELSVSFAAVSELEQLTSTLMARHKPQSGFEDLLRRFEEDEFWNDGFRLKRMRYVHLHPQKIQQVSEEITDRLRSSLQGIKPSQQQDLLDVSADFLDVMSKDGFKYFTAPKSNQLEDHVAYIDMVLQQSQDYRYLALRDLSHEDLIFLYENLPLITDRSFGYSWTSRASIEEFRKFERVLQLAGKIDYASLLRSGKALYQLSNKAWLESLKTALKNHQSKLQVTKTATDDVIYRKQLGICELLITGSGRSIHRSNASCVIDLSGDDEYRGAVAASFKDRPISILIDLGGSDIYSSADEFSQGAALLGTSLLIDVSGNDSYMATQLAQGAAVAGTGIAVDYAGDDVYQAQEYAQGFALFGFGALLDYAGRDDYRGALYVQGVASTKGLGLLYDERGDDFYQATGKFKSSYGDLGMFSGYSQGFGIGMRSLTSGGLGVLMDGQGRDDFKAGDFSQGGGYYFGYGILRSYGREDDRYLGSRYSQGFMAHSAVGAFLEEGGNDSYQTGIGATLGSAWDLGVALFVDHAGNDVYQTQPVDFAFGSAAHNGFGVFWDRSGTDRYTSGLEAMGSVPANDYHGGSSLAFFIDDGGQTDTYDFTREPNNKITTQGEFGIWCDLTP